MNKLESSLISDNTLIWKRESSNKNVSYIQRFLSPGILKIAGPCSLQELNQALEIVSATEQHIDLLRAPVLKPRTNRFSREGNEIFSGIGIEKGISIYRKIHEKYPGIGIASEVMSPDHLISLESSIMLGWIGSRTQDQYLLESIGYAATKTQTPIMIKNAMIPDLTFDVGRINNVVYGINSSSNITGLPPVPIIYCLRGVHPLGKSEYRNKPNWHELTKIKESFPDLPVLIDPSHILKHDDVSPENVFEILRNAFGSSNNVKPDGFIIEVNHPNFPSYTDPGIEVGAFISLLGEFEKLK